MISEIMERVIKIERVRKKDADHFALCNKDQIRYLISPDGKKTLSKNITAYSGVLSLLLKLLPYIPFSVISVVGLGYYVKSSLSPDASHTLNELAIADWNMIVGTYGPQQKLVIQCFCDDKDSVFIKIADSSSSEGLKKEKEFLSKRKNFQSFKIPELLEVPYKEQNLFVQVTKDFKGKKVEPVLTKDIVEIYREIAATDSFEDIEFSHGDFAPWNLRKTRDGYVVFDWEYCGYRAKGFDLMHYIFSIKTRLEKKDADTAFDEGLDEIKRFIPDFKIDRNEFEREYERIRM